MQGITIIGAGRLGGALAFALRQAGEHIDALIFRQHRPPKGLVGSLEKDTEILTIDRLDVIRSRMVIVAIQDDDLPEIPARLRGKLSSGTAILHTSGSVSSEVLAPLRLAKCHVGSMHPLASITSWKDGSAAFRGAYFGIEGDAKAIAAGRRLARKLGGHPFDLLTEKKALYHAAAVMSAGHVTALFDAAAAVMVESGVARSKARTILQPLLLTVAENLRTNDTPAALTGTFARGDTSTLKRHLEALDDAANENEMNIYLDLAERSIEIAKRASVDDKKAAQMCEMIKLAKERKR